MSDKLFIAKMIRTASGKMEYKNPRDKLLFKEHVESLRIGQIVEIVIDFSRDNAALSDIAKIHAMIGEISKENGDDFEEVKIQVKKRAGLYKINEELKSFADASDEDLKEAIKAARSIGEFLGIAFKY
jgi:hypothetical protein